MPGLFPGIYAFSFFKCSTSRFNLLLKTGQVKYCILLIPVG